MCGTVKLRELESAFSAKTQEGLTEMITSWDVKSKDGVVTLLDFENYYKDISAVIASDA